MTRPRESDAVIGSKTDGAFEMIQRMRVVTGLKEELRDLYMSGRLVRQIGRNGQQLGSGAAWLVVREQKLNQFEPHAAASIGAFRRPRSIQRIVIEPHRLRHIGAVRRQSRYPPARRGPSGAQSILRPGRGRRWRRAPGRPR